jgi:hypothetical protein
MRSGDKPLFALTGIMRHFRSLSAIENIRGNDSSLVPGAYRAVVRG